jgi:hypothetical protein
MRNQLNEVALIERYLFRQLSEDENRAFEARVMLDEALAEKVEAQRSAYRLIRGFARRSERHRLEEIYRQLLEETAFAQQIKTIFA